MVLEDVSYSCSCEFFTIGRLSDRSLQREKQKKNSSKIAPSGVGNQDLRVFLPMPYQLS